MRFLAIAAVLLAAPAFAQPVPTPDPATDANLLAAVQALSAKVDQLAAAQTVGPPVQSITLSDLGCDGGMITTTETRTLPTVLQTTRTITPPFVTRFETAPAWSYDVNALKLLFLRHRIRQVGPYYIEHRPRLFGLLGTRVNIYQ